MATYHIYVDWHVPGYHARVHRSTCSFCNEGKGIHRRARYQYGRWYGPFETFQQAYAAAQQLGRYRHRCKHCKPA